MARRLRPEQREVDHIQPAQNAVDDCPKYRMVGSVGYRDSKGGTKAHAVFRSLDSNAVVTVFHDYLSCRIRIKPPEGPRVLFNSASSTPSNQGQISR